MKVQAEQICIDGNIILLRSPEPEDAETFLKVRMITTEETHYMARYPEEVKMNLEETAVMIQAVNDSEDEFLIGAFCGDTMAGCVGIAKMGTHIKYRHKAGLGISILQKYCAQGLGTKMMKKAIEEAKKTKLEQLELGVFDDNSRARHLYSKLGFTEWGREPKAFKMKDGTYHDEIQMILFLR